MVVGAGLVFTGKLIWNGKTQEGMAVLGGFGVLIKVIIDAYFADKDDKNNNDIPDSDEKPPGNGSGTGTPA